jgi:hypothetical protein
MAARLCTDRFSSVGFYMLLLAHSKIVQNQANSSWAGKISLEGDFLMVIIKGMDNTKMTAMRIKM